MTWGCGGTKSQWRHAWKLLDNWITLLEISCLVPTTERVVGSTMGVIVGQTSNFNWANSLFSWLNNTLFRWPISVSIVGSTGNDASGNNRKYIRLWYYWMWKYRHIKLWVSVELTIVTDLGQQNKRLLSQLKIELSHLKVGQLLPLLSSQPPFQLWVLSKKFLRVWFNCLTAFRRSIEEIEKLRKLEAY